MCVSIQSILKLENKMTLELFLFFLLKQDKYLKLHIFKNEFFQLWFRFFFVLYQFSGHQFVTPFRIINIKIHLKLMIDLIYTSIFIKSVFKPMILPLQYSNIIVKYIIYPIQCSNMHVYYFL